MYLHVYLVMPPQPGTLGESSGTLGESSGWSSVHQEEEDHFGWIHVSGSLPGRAVPNR